jgi:hypothetical protein
VSGASPGEFGLHDVITPDFSEMWSAESVKKWETLFATKISAFWEKELVLFGNMCSTSD